MASGTFTFTQEILDEHGWSLGRDFYGSGNLTLTNAWMDASNGVFFWVVDGVIYKSWNHLSGKWGLINHFNKLWYDNRTSGLASTDMKSAIDELATKIPDLSNYYTKIEVQTQISSALSAIGVAEEGTY